MEGESESIVDQLTEAMKRTFRKDQKRIDLMSIYQRRTSVDNEKPVNACIPVEISEDDIIDAMKAIPGYLDITVGDFKEVYQAAFTLAVQRLTEAVKVGEVMITDVVTARLGTPLKDVAQMMAQKCVSGIPIVDNDGRVAGVVSENDFLTHMAGEGKNTFMEVIATCLSGSHCLAVPIKAQTAKDVMTAPAIVASAQDSIFIAAKLMSEKKINRLPVVDSERRLIGIISRADVLRYPLPKVAP
jgi:CBS domain-containing membrane protein